MSPAKTGVIVFLNVKGPFPFSPLPDAGSVVRASGSALLDKCSPIPFMDGPKLFPAGVQDSSGVLQEWRGVLQDSPTSVQDSSSSVQDLSDSVQESPTSVQESRGVLQELRGVLQEPSGSVQDLSVEHTFSQRKAGETNFERRRARMERPAARGTGAGTRGATTISATMRNPNNCS